MRPILTVGLATYDDYDGVFFTIQSIRMHHMAENIEFIVLDNNPESKHGEETKKFVETQVKGKYIPYTDKSSSFSKYEIIKYATGKYYLGLDCHVLLMPDAISHLLRYFEQHYNCRDIVQGPLVYDDLHHISTHFEPGWSGGMYGKWQTDKESFDRGIPFEIQMNGMGLFACETSNWPLINPHFKGFGGEEFYIQEKFRCNGGKAMCLPQLQWMHRFARPHGIPYKNIWEDRVWNYYLGWWELFPDVNHPMILSIEEHFQQYLSMKTINDIFEEVINL
jgi:hypothetical protein